MIAKQAFFALVTMAVPVAAATAEKPRVFITESHALQLSGDGAASATAAVSVMGGTSPENTEVMKTFLQRCPEVVVTGNREKAGYVVRLDHEAANPTTPFVRGNKVAVFNRDEDLIYSSSTRLLGNAVKGACAAITRDSHK